MRLAFRTVDFARVRAPGARAMAPLVLHARRRGDEASRAGFGRAQGPLERAPRLSYDAPRSRRRSRSPLPTARALAFSP